jgi:hypothetical protein
MERTGHDASDHATNVLGFDVEAELEIACAELFVDVEELVEGETLAFATVDGFAKVVASHVACDLDVVALGHEGFLAFHELPELFILLLLQSLELPPLSFVLSPLSMSQDLVIALPFDVFGFETELHGALHFVEGDFIVQELALFSESEFGAGQAFAHGVQTLLLQLFGLGLDPHDAIVFLAERRTPRQAEIPGHDLLRGVVLLRAHVLLLGSLKDLLNSLQVLVFSHHEPRSALFPPSARR